MPQIGYGRKFLRNIRNFVEKTLRFTFFDKNLKKLLALCLNFKVFLVKLPIHISKNPDFLHRVHNEVFALHVGKSLQ